MQSVWLLSFSVWTEFMVRVRIRVRVAVCVAVILQCLDGVYG